MIYQSYWQSSFCTRSHIHFNHSHPMLCRTTFLFKVSQLLSRPMQACRAWGCMDCTRLHGIMRGGGGVSMHIRSVLDMRALTTVRTRSHTCMQRRWSLVGGLVLMPTPSQLNKQSCFSVCFCVTYRAHLTVVTLVLCIHFISADKQSHLWAAFYGLIYALELLQRLLCDPSFGHHLICDA